MWYNRTMKRAAQRAAKMEREPAILILFGFHPMKSHCFSFWWGQKFIKVDGFSQKDGIRRRKPLDIGAILVSCTCESQKSAKRGKVAHQVAHFGGASAKREGTGCPVPSQKVLVYPVWISRSNAPAGPSEPCRGGPQLDTAHKNTGRISLLLSENTHFPSISLQKLDFGKAWYYKGFCFPWDFPTKYEPHYTKHESNYESKAPPAGGALL